MILYKGRVFSTEKVLKFALEIESCYDVGTLMFKGKDSLICYLMCDGEIVSGYFDCQTIDEKEELQRFAEEHRVSISWLD